MHVELEALRASNGTRHEAGQHAHSMASLLCFAQDRGDWWDVEAYLDLSLSVALILSASFFMRSPLLAVTRSCVFASFRFAFSEYCQTGVLVSLCTTRTASIGLQLVGDI